MTHDVGYNDRNLLKAYKKYSVNGINWFLV
jgi:hypothetical protein